MGLRRTAQDKSVPDETAGGLPALLLLSLGCRVMLRLFPTIPSSDLSKLFILIYIYFKV